MTRIQDFRESQLKNSEQVSLRSKQKSGPHVCEDRIKGAASQAEEENLDSESQLTSRLKQHGPSVKLFPCVYTQPHKSSATYDYAEPHKGAYWTVSLSFCSSDSSDRKGLYIEHAQCPGVQIVDKKDELEVPYLVCTVLK
jgi:hypothetical protein